MDKTKVRPVDAGLFTRSVNDLFRKKLYGLKVTESEDLIHWSRTGGRDESINRARIFALLEKYAKDYCEWAKNYVDTIVIQRFGKKAHESIYRFSCYAWNTLAVLRILSSPKRLRFILSELSRGVVIPGVGVITTEKSVHGIKSLLSIFTPWLEGLSVKLKGFIAWLKSMYAILAEFVIKILPIPLFE